MSQFYVYFYYSLSAALIALMLYQGLKRKVDLLSHRNFYLTGFIFFQLLSAAATISSDDYRPVRIENLRAALEMFMWYVIVFLICFFLSYHKNPISWRLASVFRPRRSYVANDWLLMMVALVCLGLGLFLRFVAWRYGPLSYFAGFVPAFPAACAIVAWVWGGRRFNLFVVAIGCLVFSTSILLSVWGINGRRPLLEVCLAIAWGAFHRMHTRLPMGKILLWSIPILLVGLHLLGAMSLHRRNSAFGVTSGITVSRILKTSPMDSLRSHVRKQDDAKFTLWALDAYPDRIEQKHLFSFYFMMIHPIPRALWQDKPEPLSKHVAKLADIKGVAQDKITLPPCVLGYAQAEGGLYALVLYGLFFGMFTRFFDEIVRQNRGNPFLVLTVGCTLGQVVGLARGDIAIFANLVTLGFLSVWFMMLVSRFLIGRRLPPSEIPYTYAPMSMR